MKHAGGRPKVYTQAFIEAQAVALLKYAENCQKNGDPMFVERFSSNQGYSSARCREWANPTHKDHNAEFSAAFSVFKDKQLVDIAEGALKQRYDAGFAFRALKNVSGWRDEQHIQGMAPQIINVIRAETNGSSPKKLAGQVHIHRSSLSGNGVSLGNGKKPLPDPSGS